MKNRLPSPEVMYDLIRNGSMSSDQFEQWLRLKLKAAYDQGVYDADSPPTYDDISRSQYD